MPVDTEELREMQQQVAVHAERLASLKDAVGEHKRAHSELSLLVVGLDKRVESLTTKLGFVVVAATAAVQVGLKLWLG